MVERRARRSSVIRVVSGGTMMSRPSAKDRQTGGTAELGSRYSSQSKFVAPAGQPTPDNGTQDRASKESVRLLGDEGTSMLRVRSAVSRPNDTPLALEVTSRGPAYW